VPYEVYIKQGGDKRYLVTQNLTHITSSLVETSVVEDGSIEATLTADTGYIVDTVTVLMGGEDVTSTAWNESESKVSIAAVTGDVVITAVGSEDV
jgi:hypothetical protein